jgi:autophagy-related protein 5
MGRCEATYVHHIFISDQALDRAEAQRLSRLKLTNHMLTLLDPPDDLPAFTRITTTLLPPLNQHFRNIPLRIYVPSSPSPSITSDPTPPGNPPTPTSPDPPQPPSDQTTPSLKIIQSPIPPLIPSSSQRSRPQTLGTALHTLLPGLFPSRSRPVLAVPILHGAQIPMGAVLEEVARWAGYVDGWVCVVVRMV